MPTHRLKIDRSRDAGVWTITWDDATLHVLDAEEQEVLALPTQQAHRVLDLGELEVEGKIAFRTDVGLLTFAKDAAAARDAKALIASALRNDVEFRDAQRRHARRMLPISAIAFLVCSSLFVGYCWYASWAPDPPPGHWLYAVGFLIHGVLLICLGVMLGAPFVFYKAVQQLSRIREIEQDAMSMEASPRA